MKPENIYQTSIFIEIRVKGWVLIMIYNCCRNVTAEQIQVGEQLFSTFRAIGNKSSNLDLSQFTKVCQVEQSTGSFILQNNEIVKFMDKCVSGTIR